MKLKHLGIRKQVLYLVLACSLITLFIAGGISLYGMFDIKSNAVEVSSAIGEQASKNSSELLEEQQKNELIEISIDKASDTEHNLADLASDAEMISAQMHDIYLNPQNFLPQSVNTPNQNQPGRINFYIQYAENFNPSEFENEIAFNSRIKYFLIRTAENNPMIDSIFVSSKYNFTLSADDDRNKTAENFSASNIIYDALSRDWYKEAVEKNGVIFTKVRKFVFSKKLGLFCATPYYDAYGQIAGVVGVQASLERINKIVQDVDFHDRGFCFVVDDQNKIILSSKERFEFGADSDFEFPGIQGIIEKEIDGKNYFVAYSAIKNMNWTFAVAIDKAEIVKPVEENNKIIKNLTDEHIEQLDHRIFSTMLLLGIFVLILTISVTYIGRNLSDQLVHPLHELSEGVREIASGNLDKKIDIKTGNEIEHLAVCFNAMTDELQTYMKNLTKVTAERERIATELNVAKNIQVSMLPRDFDFNNKNFELYAKMKAAKEVGGDFYDFYMLDENHLVVTMADVSGKGVPAALFMMMSKTILKNLITITTSPDDFSAAVRLTNDQLCQNNDAMMFVTVFVGMLDLKTGEFIFVNGGHNPPLIYKKSENKFEYLKVAKNFVLGAMDDLDFVQQSVKLDEGDLIFLYTDGVTEAFNDAGEQYSEERLKNCLNSSDRNLSVKDLISFVRADVDKHADGAEQSDDITMLGLRFKK